MAAQPRRILVTGGAGFVGSHLCEHLLAAGHGVVCLDDLSTGDVRNIAALRASPRFEFVECDIVKSCAVRGEVHAVFNLACTASPPRYQRDPIQTLMTSVMGLRNVLELARRRGARVLQASTSEVYGDPEVHPQPETYRGSVNCTGPRACYDEGKRAAETLLYDYRRVHGLDVRVARIFNTYGPRMQPDDGRVVSTFIAQARRGETLTVFGDGQQTRSFCHVDDLVSGLIRLMDVEPMPDGPVNIGMPGECTMLELARAVIAATGSTSNIRHVALPQDDPRRRCPDIARARHLLGWEPRISLAVGLRRLVDERRVNDAQGPSPKA